MEVREKQFGRKDFYEAYVSQINWDWLFLKAQLFFGAILLIGLAFFMLWFLQ